MKVGVAPIKRKLRVAEFAVRADFQILEFAEIVRIQFKKVSQDRLLTGRGRDKFDMWQAGLCYCFTISILAFWSTRLISQRPLPIVPLSASLLNEPMTVRGKSERILPKEVRAAT